MQELCKTWSNSCWGSPGAGWASTASHSSRQGRAWQVSLHPGVSRQCIESRAGQKKHTAFGTCVDPSVCIDPSYLSFVVLDKKESLALSLKAYLRK